MAASFFTRSPTGEFICTTFAVYFLFFRFCLQKNIRKLLLISHVTGKVRIAVSYSTFLRQDYVSRAAQGHCELTFNGRTQRLCYRYCKKLKV